MPSPFGDAWRAAYPALESAFGDPEGFRLEPMRAAGDVNGRPVPDPARPEVAFSGIFDAEPASAQPEGRGRSGRYVADISSAPPELDAPAAAFPEPPRRGDRILRLSTGERFVIAAKPASDLGRLTIRLNRA